MLFLADSAHLGLPHCLLCYFPLSKCVFFHKYFCLCLPFLFHLHSRHEYGCSFVLPYLSLMSSSSKRKSKVSSYCCRHLRMTHFPALSIIGRFSIFFPLHEMTVSAQESHVFLGYKVAVLVFCCIVCWYSTGHIGWTSTPTFFSLF